MTLTVKVTFWALPSHTSENENCVLEKITTVLLVSQDTEFKGLLDAHKSTSRGGQSWFFTELLTTDNLVCREEDILAQWLRGSTHQNLVTYVKPQTL